MMNKSKGDRKHENQQFQSLFQKSVESVKKVGKGEKGSKNDKNGWNGTGFWTFLTKNARIKNNSEQSNVMEKKGKMDGKSRKSIISEFFSGKYEERSKLV
jgi:hypothetical protein